MQLSFGHAWKNPLQGLGLLVLIASASQRQVSAQELASVGITVKAPVEVHVSIKTSFPSKRWSFRNSYATAFGLGDRIENFQARNDAGRTVIVHHLASGEFQSEEEATDYNYTVRLPNADPTSLPHVSWLTTEYGFLMLADLLPQSLIAKASADQALLIKLELPNRWLARSALVEENNRFKVDDPEAAIFFVGSSIREIARSVAGMRLELFVSGSWLFKDSKAIEMAARVLRSYFELTGFQLHNTPVVMIAPMPFSSSLTKWKAETRGSSIILALNPLAESSTWIGQLGVIFTHEVFHLWVPNSLKLQGDYDWFFEGFTLYQALLTALDLKLISFQGYLDTLARVYDSYLSYTDNQSLLDASERRWTTANSVVYDKGMLVAFMYDLALRQQSDGSMRLSNIYPKLLTQFAGKQADANKAIISLLGSSTAMRDFTSNFIESKNRLDLEHFLSNFGFVLDSEGARSHLMTKTPLSVKQQALLRSLGFRK